jgi:hypothetical protein
MMFSSVSVQWADTVVAWPGLSMTRTVLLCISANPNLAWTT